MKGEPYLMKYSHGLNRRRRQVRTRRATRSTKATVMQETTDDDRTGSDNREIITRTG